MILQPNPEQEFSKERIVHSLDTAMNIAERYIGPQELLNAGRDALHKAVWQSSPVKDKQHLAGLIGAEDLFARVLETAENGSTEMTEGHLGVAAALMEIADTGFIAPTDAEALEQQAWWHINKADKQIEHRLRQVPTRVVVELALMRDDLEARQPGHKTHSSLQALRDLDREMPINLQRMVNERSAHPDGRPHSLAVDFVTINRLAAA